MFAAAIVETGLGLETLTTCRAAILVCLVFYVGSKVLMYVFLIERAHSVRAPYISRSKDWLWLAGMIFIFLGFGTVALVAFLFPIADISSNDGKCRIGLPFKVTIPLLSFDCVINVALTGIFIFLLRPILRLGAQESAPYWRKKFIEALCRLLSIKQYAADDMHQINISLIKSVEKLVYKSTIGCVLVLIPTMANLSLLFYMRGKELGWLCLTLCSLDGIFSPEQRLLYVPLSNILIVVTWAVAVIHWLTVDPTELEGRIVDLPVSENTTARHRAAL